MKYACIRDHEREFHVRTMCRVLGVSAAGYYAWRRRAPSPRAAANDKLLKQIEAAHVASRGTYGAPKIYRHLRRGGEQINHKRVARLMRTNAIRSKRVKRFRVVTTNSRHGLPIAENLLARRFTATRPDEVWTTDITYIPTNEGWLYLVVFLDLYARLIVGWAVSENLATEFVERALVCAQRRRGTAVTPLVHSDRGSQYASAAFQERLAAWGCPQSMSRRADCWDNAVTESFFGILKNELVHHERFATRREAHDKLFDYIEVFYNRSRIHSATNYLTPAEYEARYRAQMKRAA